MHKHIIYSLVATILWGFWAILVKVSATRIGHWPSVFIYTVFSFALVLVLFFSSNQSLQKVDTIGFIQAGFAGILGGLALVAFQKAVASGPISTSTAISALYPVIAIVFGVLFLKEHLSFLNYIGIAFAVIAGILISI